MQDSAARVFAANRAVGAVTMDARADGARTRRGDVHEMGSLRVRFPSSADGGLTAMFVNTAGGIAGGDRFDIAIHARAGSRVTATTAAAEKIYRSSGADSEIGVRLRVDADARLIWLPQETILFDRALASRRIEIDVADTASLLLAEIVVFGRSAMDERMLSGRFVDRWRLRRSGRLAFAETVRLDGDVGAAMAGRAAANGACAVATLLVSPGDEALAARLCEAASGLASEVGVSAWNGLLLARFLSGDAARLRTDVATVLRLIDPRAAPRTWLN
jgi:urease accessory protein